MTYIQAVKVYSIEALKLFAGDIVRAIGVPEPDFDSRAAMVKAVGEAEQKMRKLRFRLLLDLANLPANDPRLLRLMESFDPTPQEGIAAFQKALQFIWNRDVSIAAKQWMVDVFYSAATLTSDYAGVYAVLGAGKLLFAVKNFPGQILTGILEHWGRMARCANPECSVPYFFAKRSSQIYCERGECTQYALRKKAREYWRKSHKKRK